MQNKLFFLLLALLGFSACDKSGKVEYGVPTARFAIKGRVTDTSGVPLRNIVVAPDKAWPFDPEKPDAESWKDGVEQAAASTTGEDGQFETQGSCFGYAAFRVSLRIDDPAGREFESREEIVELGPEQLTDDGSWTSVYVRQIGDIQLEKTEE